MRTRVPRDTEAARRARRPSTVGTAGWGQAQADRAQVRSAVREPAGWKRSLDGHSASRIRGFGGTLPDVTVHTDSPAATGSIQAVTQHGEIHFRAGAYQPGTPRGDRLIAHELAHVVQQRNTGAPLGTRRELEQQADRAAASVMEGRAANITLRADPATAYAKDERDAPDQRRDGAEVNPAAMTGQLAHVCAPLGVRLRREPNPKAPDLGILPFDTRVQILRSTGGWVHVTVMAQRVGAGTSELAGASGFVEGRFVLLQPPDASSFLHLVRPGEGAARVAARYFAPPKGFTVGNDAYLFVSALWAVNQDLRTAAGRYPGAMKERPVELTRSQTIIRAESREESLRNYLGARLVAGNALWIPSIAKVRELVRAEKISSATPLSEAGEAGGFLRGLYDGIVDGLRDLVKQAKELGQFLYELFEEGLIAKLIEIAEQITKLIRQLDVDSLVAAGKSALIDFVRQWTDEDPFVRGHFQGKTIGYLVVLILPNLLTEGLGQLAAAPRALRAVEQLGAVIADRGELVAGLSSNMRRAKIGDRLLQSGYLKREGLLAEKFEGGFPAIEKRFDPHLDEVFGEDEPWGGFMRDRHEPTSFRPDERRINFQMERNMSKFSVAEEVQHAIDFTLGAKKPEQIAAMARKLGIPDEDIVDWWHRRVFTRLMKNIDADVHGLGYLKPRLADVHKVYVRIGGKLPLEQILSTTWEGLY